MGAIGKRSKDRSNRGSERKAKATAAKEIGSASAEEDATFDRDTGRRSPTEELDLTSLGAASADNPTTQTQIMDHMEILDEVAAEAGGREMVEPTGAVEDTEVTGKAGAAGRIEAAPARAEGFLTERPNGRIWIAVGAAAGLALLFLVLAVVGFSMASSRADRLEELEQEAARLRGELASLPGAADVEKWKRIAEEEERARRSSEEQVARLEAAIADAKAESEGLRANAEIPKLEREALEEELVKAMVRSEDAARDAERANQLQTKVEEVTRLLTKATEDLTTLRAEHSRAVDENARLQEGIGDIEREKGPLEVLPEKEAEQEFRAAIETAAAADEPDKRIDLFRELTFALAGTRYGPPAARLWNREKKLKQADIDRAAARVYKKAIRTVRSTPKAHAENVETLKSALSGVEGSKYEKTIRELIEREEAKLPPPSSDVTP